jgi:hypothetical protein
MMLRRGAVERDALTCEVVLGVSSGRGGARVELAQADSSPDGR